MKEIAVLTLVSACLQNILTVLPLCKSWKERLLCPSKPLECGVASKKCRNTLTAVHEFVVHCVLIMGFSNLHFKCLDDPLCFKLSFFL